MKASKSEEILWVFQDSHNHLITQGLKISHMCLNNKALSAFHISLQKKGIDLQLYPPVTNIHNAEEKSVITFKEHLIVIILSTDPLLTMHNWYRIIDQEETALNLLMPSIINLMV